MEGSIYLLTYKGSIPSAIAEARKQKKLFTVYISGDSVNLQSEDENSVNMEQSTWVDPRVSKLNQHIIFKDFKAIILGFANIKFASAVYTQVAEIISRCCVFLHLTHGSVSASQFSAIYPQQSFPSISAIGLNGVILWHHEGYISAESLKENIEKAFAALCLQETAATLLSATLVSRDAEPSSSTYTAGVAPADHDIPSSLEHPSTLANIAPPEMEAPTATVPMVSHQLPATLVSQDTELNSSSPSSGVPPAEHGILSSSEPSASLTSIAATETVASLGSVPMVSHQATEERLNESSNQEILKEDVKININNEETTHSVVKDVNASGTFSQRDVSFVEDQPLDTGNATGSTGLMKKHEHTSAMKNTRLNDRSGSVKSNDVHINIRMPDGSSLKMKLTLADRLNSVKTFVDENKTTQLGSYDLAVPYPRKLFSDQDMTRTLTELGFGNREGLIVVPHHRRQVSTPSRDQSSSIDNQTVGDGSGGYFHYAKRFLSYLNPLSYFSANASSSETTANDSSREYGSNSAIGNGSSNSQSPQSSYPTNYRNPVVQDNASRRTSRPFSSNIHTLRHDEEDGPSPDKNVFWNGNSTQFGGDNK